MSRAGELTGLTTVSRPARLGLGLDPHVVADQFRSALVFNDGNINKPDTKDFFPDLGSPVSPLRPSAAVSTTTNTSSSSSSSCSVSGRASQPTAAVRRSNDSTPPDRPSHSGELSCESNPTAVVSRNHLLKPAAHRRSGSGPLIYSGGSGSSSSASSPTTNVLPAGNICPSGKIGKTGMMPRTTARSDMLGSGTGNYGHGSIMRGGTSSGGGAAASSGMGNLGNLSGRKSMGSTNPEEVTRTGNEHYKKGQYAEALTFYDQAVAVCPDNAACRSNRAAALMGLGRLDEAVRECEEAVRLDPGNGRAHHRLSCIYLRLGQVEFARKHLLLTGQQQPDPVESQRLQDVERRLLRCGDARKLGDWKSALREADAAIAAGADSSQLLTALKAEALLKLNQLDEADSVLSNSPRFENTSPSLSVTKFFGMLPNSYFYIVRAQVDMALGRFENAVSAAEKARQMDPKNVEVSTVLNNVRSVASARAQGNQLFKSGNFAEACTAYGEGLIYDPSNPVLLCNRAACRSKLGQWEKSLEDCNEALRFQPSYRKALLRRADSNAKLERWAEAVRDYEVLRKESPGDTDLAEALFHAQVALKTSRGEEVSDLKFGGEVELVTSTEQLHAAISLPGASVVYFTGLNQQCSQMSAFINALCTKYPSVNFLKVDVNGSPVVAKDEKVYTVPTFKFFKNGQRLKEMIRPSQQNLEHSVMYYSI